MCRMGAGKSSCRLPETSEVRQALQEFVDGPGQPAQLAHGRHVRDWRLLSAHCSGLLDQSVRLEILLAGFGGDGDVRELGQVPTQAHRKVSEQVLGWEDVVQCCADVVEDCLAVVGGPLPQLRQDAGQL
ncbi:hypothetical protein SAM23877_0260 [Streptomyces ambofaciens ATCC 23877]|uniref:Uncharacterized protein n=1 Tax=Streptomyces ambofaciens (strain ATCC 23877 / 3486 / DSM 40053 / JCM 4204 / NBRC 12836 / NRRL B-2516) TaxID=278992 RepID=A0A0K2AJY6_STRA7|nr:hypothetical protein SAM23877_0260 [Streptomyces ambofaciens ATCC 23877]